MEVVEQLELLCDGVVIEDAVAGFMETDVTYVVGYIEEIEFEGGADAVPSLDNRVTLNPEVKRLDFGTRCRRHDVCPFGILGEPFPFTAV